MFYKDHLDKTTAIFKAIDNALLMARPTIKATTKPTASKQKQGQPPNSTNKQVKKNWAAFGFYCIFAFFWSMANLHIKTFNLKVT